MQDLSQERGIQGLERMTDQPRDLAKEVEIIREVHRLGGSQHNDIDTLLEHIASQSRELAALRRPVVQSEAIESIRATIAELKQYWSGNPGDVPYNLTRYFEHGDILLSALDQAQRENRALYLKVEALEQRSREDSAALFVAIGQRDSNREAIELSGKRNQELVSALEAARTEIARLSSPPEERRDIQERQRDRKATGFGRPHSGSLIADVDTLLEDLRRYENSHAIVMGERDAALAKADRLDQSNVILRGAQERLLLQIAERTGDEIDRTRRIERLEGALQWYANPGHWTVLDDGSDQEQENLLTAGMDHGWLRAHNALAAGDGQQT